MNLTRIVLRSTGHGRIGPRRLLHLNPAAEHLRASGIREIMVLATEMSKSAPVIHLEVGQPNFATPAHIIAAAVKALQAGKTTYISNDGIAELKLAVAGRFARVGFPTSPEEVVVTVGSSLSLYSLLQCILSPGDECLLPMPGFPNYESACSMLHAIPMPYLCSPCNGYLPELADIERSISPRTRCIVLCNPGNPTGAVYSAQKLRQICQLAEQRGLFVISDEIYSDITFDAPHVSALSCLDVISSERLAVVAGVSKGYAMTGFRVGWTRCHSKLAKVLTKLQEPMVSCGSAFAQYAAVAALQGPQDDLINMKKAYHLRRDRALQILSQRNRPSAFIPGGAFYLPLDVTASGMDSKSFALRLLRDYRVAIAPGTAFSTMHHAHAYDPADVKAFTAVLNGFCRVSLANSTEAVEQGVTAICDLLDELQQCTNVTAANSG